MPTLSSKHTNDPLKMLVVGDSGTGKSGALASLITAGYELFILDFDNKADVLAKFIPPGTNTDKVHIEGLWDKPGMIGQKLGVPFANAFPKALQLCNKWVDSETKKDYGVPNTWSTDKVLVLDTLTFCGNAALNYVQMINKHADQGPTQPDWGEAMRMIEMFLGMLNSLPCHVIVLAHILYQQRTEAVIMKGLPMALGEKLPPKIAGFFNMMLLAKTHGIGDATKRMLFTKPEGVVDAKCPLLDAPRSLPIETGFATIFQLWNKGSATPVSTVQPMTQKVQAQ